jgi:hypothetical protein
MATCNDFADYEYSSASFYEKGTKKYENLVHINDSLNNLIPGLPSHKPNCEDPGLTSGSLLHDKTFLIEQEFR